MFKRWQKRFFVLEKKVLKYFKTDGDFHMTKLPKGVINFQQIMVKADFKDLQYKIDL